MIVAGSGELLNPTRVLTPTAISRLNAARGSDKTIMIRKLTDSLTRLHHARCIRVRFYGISK